MKKIILITCLSVGLFIVGCRKQHSTTITTTQTPVLPATPYDYQSRFKHQPITGWGGNFDSINNQVATLGRVLFYEKKLSANGTVSCGSCHMQNKAFADLKASSNGLVLGKTPRNSPTICNISSQSRFFLDGRETDLGEMVLKPIGNHLEMGIDDVNTIVPRVQQLDYYKPLFKNAFGDENITLQRIAVSLKTFLKSIVSFESKFDLAPSSNNNSYFTLDERIGRQLFNASLPCSQCHSGNNMTGWSGSDFRNIGLETSYTDKGATFMNIGSAEQVEGFFKVPTLRNIALTGPYMHDGRFNTLEEVIDFYTKNIQPHPNLSSNLQTGGWSAPKPVLDPAIEAFAEVPSNASTSSGEPIRFQITDYQKRCLIAYLNTFTDTKMITEPMYSDPFVK